MQEILQTHQLHRLHHPGIAHHQEVLAVLLELLGQLDQGTEAGGIEEVDAAQIENHRLGSRAELSSDKIDELLVGIGVELAGEAEQQALRLQFAAPTEGDGQSLQV